MTRIYRIYECLTCGMENEEPGMDWDEETGRRLCPDCGSDAIVPAAEEEDE
jgi:DNA-directed RNA polymerase subunit RPC12/RpoP